MTKAGLTPTPAGTTSDQAWVLRAYRVIKNQARRNKTVHVDDVWTYAINHNWPEPLNRKSLGKAFTMAKNDGLIRCSDVAVKVHHNGGHYWRPIWLSNTYVEPKAKALSK